MLLPVSLWHSWLHESKTEMFYLNKMYALDKYSQSLLSFGTKLCLVAPVYHTHLTIMTMQQVLQSIERSVWDQDSMAASILGHIISKWRQLLYINNSNNCTACSVKMATHDQQHNGFVLAIKLFFNCLLTRATAPSFRRLYFSNNFGTRPKSLKWKLTSPPPVVCICYHWGCYVRRRR